VISRRTIFWFVLLLLSSAALWVHNYQESRPCREWKKAHLNAQPTAENTNEGEVSFSPCDVMWESMPLWVRVCALTWLISFVAFIKCLVVDLYRWFSLQRQKRRVASE
jgi:hypothetical protein